MKLIAILKWILNHKKVVKNGLFSLILALSVLFGTIVHNDNKTLRNELNNAKNNIEVYLGIISDAQLANGVLKLDMNDLRNNNDLLIQQLDSVREKLKINSKGLNTAATQTQTLHVNGGKGVDSDTVVIVKEYNDSIRFNDETIVYYSLQPDSVNIALDISNTQYLYIYKTREYKNNKSFFKRLFTLDFKKVDKYKYSIANTNDLIKESDLRVIQK